MKWFFDLIQNIWKRPKHVVCSIIDYPTCLFSPQLRSDNFNRYRQLLRKRRTGASWRILDNNAALKIYANSSFHTVNIWSWFVTSQINGVGCCSTKTLLLVSKGFTSLSPSRSFSIKARDFWDSNHSLLVHRLIEQLTKNLEVTTVVKIFRQPFILQWITSSDKGLPAKMVSRLSLNPDNKQKWNLIQLNCKNADKPCDTP